MEVTDEIVKKAIYKGAQLKMWPQYIPKNQYIGIWSNIKDLLVAAVETDEDFIEEEVEKDEVEEINLVELAEAKLKKEVKKIGHVEIKEEEKDEPKEGEQKEETEEADAPENKKEM